MSNNVAKGFLIGLGVIGAALLLALFALGYQITLGNMPSSEVVQGSELKPAVRRGLVEHGIVGEDEEILYFYSEDITSFYDYGNILTDSKVIAYETDDLGERQVYSTPIVDINEFELIQDESKWVDSELYVYARGEFQFYLYLDALDGGDKVFFDKLVELWSETPQYYRIPEGLVDGAKLKVVNEVLGGQGFLISGESVINFYSEAPEDYSHYGNFYSNIRVAAYEVNDDDEMVFLSTSVDAVTALDWQPPGSDEDYGLIKVSHSEGDPIYLASAADLEPAKGQAQGSQLYINLASYLGCEALAETRCAVSQ